MSSLCRRPPAASAPASQNKDCDAASLLLTALPLQRVLHLLSATTAITSKDARAVWASSACRTETGTTVRDGPRADNSADEGPAVCRQLPCASKRLTTTIVATRHDPATALRTSAGFFEGDRFHGDGSYFYRGGDVYSGSWQRGVKHGSGTFLTSTDGSQLTGTWFRGSMVSGKWIWADGTVWLGTFRDSRPLGRGVFYFPNGTQQEGEYVLAAGEEGGESEGAFPVWKGGPFAAASLPASEVIRAPLAVA